MNLKQYMLNQERDLSGMNDLMECGGCGAEDINKCVCGMSEIVCSNYESTNEE